MAAIQESDEMADDGRSALDYYLYIYLLSYDSYGWNLFLLIFNSDSTLLWWGIGVNNLGFCPNDIYMMMSLLNDVVNPPFTVAG